MREYAKDKQIEIIRRYNKEVLKPLFGNGKIRRELTDGLVKILSEGNSSSILDLEIDTDYLSVRVKTSMRRLNIKTYRELIQYPESDFLSCRNFGKNSLRELKRHLEDRGLFLKEE